MMPLFWDLSRSLRGYKPPGVDLVRKLGSTVTTIRALSVLFFKLQTAGLKFKHSHGVLRCVTQRQDYLAIKIIDYEM